MKTVLDQSTREELMERIKSLDASCTAQWGKMNIYQMVKHCRMWEEMVIENKTYKRMFMGRLFGRLAMKSVLKDETPIQQNAPSIPEFVIKEKDGDIASEKTRWIALIEAYAQFQTPYFVHPFFGKMTKEQIGIFAYKHSDHHLRQFNK